MTPTKEEYRLMKLRDIYKIPKWLSDKQAEFVINGTVELNKLKAIDEAFNINK